MSTINAIDNMSTLCDSEGKTLPTQKRELWIDIARGIGILFVILEHTAPPFRRIIGAFHMPLFCLISGYLYKPRNREDVVKDRYRAYIVPYLILYGINLFLEVMRCILLKRYFPFITYIGGLFYSRGTTEWMPNCSPLWYLTAFFIAILLFDFVESLNGAFLRTGVIVLLGLCSGLLSYFSVPKLPVNVDSAMMMVVFIGIGYLWKSRHVFDSIVLTIPLVRIVGLFMALFLGFFAAIANPVDIVSFDGNHYGNVFLMLVAACLINFVILYVCYSISWGGFISSYLSWLGKHTLFIIGFDFFVGSLVRQLLSIMNLDDWFLIFVLKVVMLSIGIKIWTLLVKKISNKNVSNALHF